jgi:hypothetical protein
MCIKGAETNLFAIHRILWTEFLNFARLQNKYTDFSQSLLAEMPLAFVTDFVTKWSLNLHF